MKSERKVCVALYEITTSSSDTCKMSLLFVCLFCFKRNVHNVPGRGGMRFEEVKCEEFKVLEGLRVYVIFILRKILVLQQVG